MAVPRSISSTRSTTGDAMNHHILRTLAASLLALAALLLCSGCARLLSAGHVNKAGEHIQAGKYDAAIAEGTKAIEAKPDHHLAYII